MVLKRYGEDKYFTTLAPERTYKTKRGAKQAERMFLHPERWQGWTRGGREQEEQAEQEVNDIFAEVEQELDDIFAEVEQDTEEDIFYPWYDLSTAIKDKIRDSDSDKRCITRLLTNGWAGIYLSDLIEDFGNNIVDEL